jgi:hypothetical protein
LTFEQLARIRENIDGVDKDRVRECETQILEAYNRFSPVNLLSRVEEINDTTPTGFGGVGILLRERTEYFNRADVSWDLACRQMASAITFGEQRHMFDALVSEKAPVDAVGVDFVNLRQKASEMRALGLSPDILLVPIDDAVHFWTTLQGSLAWDGSAEILNLPGLPPMRVMESNGAVPLDRYVLVDTSKCNWRVKVSPDNGQRLNVAIGRVNPVDYASLNFALETFFEFEVDKDAIRELRVE